jgi:hypothetical protein
VEPPYQGADLGHHRRVGRAAIDQGQRPLRLLPRLREQRRGTDRSQAGLLAQGGGPVQGRVHLPRQLRLPGVALGLDPRPAAAAQRHRQLANAFGEVAAGWGRVHRRR